MSQQLQQVATRRLALSRTLSLSSSSNDSDDGDREPADHGEQPSTADGAGTVHA